MLEAIPEAEEIKKTLFDIDQDSSPGPDGFSGCFYRACWEIISQDVVEAIQFCWRRKFIPKGLNSNFLNGTLMHKLVSPQQVAYVKGRCIQDQILLASELVNGMTKKRRCGNVALKLDISQAYDSVSWEFLFKVLQKFGFSKNWCEWLHILFQSSKFSVMLNGGPCGFFSVGRGLRQGDPLSPILFVLMEEALSRRLSQMVQDGLICPMVERKGIHPTHLFFVDDVFIFINGVKKRILNLMKLLEDYQKISGQIINKSKSKLFIDDTSDLRKNQIKEIIQMERSAFPDKYLGVILTSGRIKVSNVWPMVEMMKRKLASWKGMERQESTINFLGKKFVHHLVKVDWYKDKNGQWSTKWQKYSVWPGLKWAWEALEEDTRWIIGNGNNIYVWFDHWLEVGILFDRFKHHRCLTENLNLKVSDILSNGEWSYNDELHQIFHHLKLPEILGGDDILVWTRNLKGEFSISDAVYKLRHKERSVNWSKFLWTHFLHPSVASNVWKLIQGIYTDDKIMVKNGYEMVSRCCICETEEDSMNHLLWKCNFSTEVSDWICSIFQFKAPKTLEDIWKCTSSCSPLIKQVWISAACIILKELWFQKNKRFFENIKPNMQGFKCRVMQLVNEGGLRMNGFGVVVRDSACQVLGTLSGGISIASNYLAESYGIMCALELEVQWNLQKIIIVSDSKSVLAEFAQGRVPWFLKGRWLLATSKIKKIQYKHCYREINFSVDCMAKKGALLAAGERQIHMGRPQCLPRVEMPDVDYFRFD
ncbi:uncharacterized protein LOC113334044 [Papaver somniferum]|uniref:uncharacterized protein LOC113334044 n=1 Tax=Papaver somniferum TaxID=3469 RepID=UPI000E6FF7AE|nr:uncharacterized protein LOC113334044 [Papaver somniferum]